MLKAFKKLWNDERGNVLIIGGAALPMLVGAAGLATDTIQWTLWKRQLQRAADSAAIAGVYDRVGNDGATTNTETAVYHDLDLNNHTLAGKGSAKLLFKQVTYPANSGTNTNQVKVTLKVQRELPFSSLFLSTAPEIIANATAASVPGPGDPCVLGLDESGSTIVVEITGNADIHMPDCILHANGSANNSAVAKGSAKVKAEAASAVGGIQQSDNWDVESYRPYSPKVDDPYAEVDPYSNPNEMKCAGVMETVNGKGKDPDYEVFVEGMALNETTVLADAKDASGNVANCFSSLSVGSGQTLTLPSGTYYINGGNAFIQGDLSCTKCTIVLTNKDTSGTATIGDFKVNADAKINMTSPDTGNFKGIAIYQDRRALDSASAQNKINGNSGSIIQGSLYFPNQELDYNGTGTTNALCTRFVAKRVKFSGNSNISNKFKSAKECAAYGLEEQNAGLRVRLVA